MVAYATCHSNRGRLGFLGVALGALAPHQLAPLLTANQTSSIWQTAVLYHLVHAVAALWLRTGTRYVWIWAWEFLSSSGSLYLLAVTNIRWLAPHHHWRLVVSRRMAAGHDKSAMIAKHQTISVSTSGKGTYEITNEVARIVRGSQFKPAQLPFSSAIPAPASLSTKTPTQAPEPTPRFLREDRPRGRRLHPHPGGTRRYHEPFANGAYSHERSGSHSPWANDPTWQGIFSSSIAAPDTRSVDVVVLGT